MHILNVIQCTNLGGMEQSALTLLTELQERGHDVEMLSLNPIGGLGPLLGQRGIPVQGLPYRGRSGWRSLPQFKRELDARMSEALIMTGHNLLAMLALGDLGSEQRLLMIHFHHRGVKPYWQWRLIYRVALRRFSAIGFASDFIRREAESIYASTTQQWGLVVNEAMAAGLPVLVSNRCGCAVDLVAPGIGFVFDPHNFDELAGAMTEISRDCCDRKAMGRASEEIVARWSPEQFAEGLGSAAEAAIRATRPGPSLLDWLVLKTLDRR